MSTLSLADFSPGTRRALGLGPPCEHPESCARATFESRYVATIPVLVITNASKQKPGPADIPGAAWLRTGLHRLRVA